jgi:cysteine desulfurase/selenocysteine lyase
MAQQESPRTRRYLDNAATSFPKPREVSDAMVAYAQELGASPGRGAYREVTETAKILQRCRERLSELLVGPPADHVIFTLNTTDALSMAINGIVTSRLLDGRRAHLITTDLDHNSVLRSFRLLAERHHNQVTVSRIACDPDSGMVDPEDIRKTIEPDTALVAVAHGSNATGTIQPVHAIGAICRKAGVPFLVDAAQTAGHRPIDMEQMQVDLLAVPGHKGLLGPLGTGALLMKQGMENLIAPTRVGGTGNLSESDSHPDTMPERYEAGSHNAIGLVGLDAALGWILQRSIESLASHEHELAKLMLEGLLDMPGIRLLGPTRLEDRCGVFTFVHHDLEASQVAHELEKKHGILCRSGLHCAPFAHQTFGTDPISAGSRGREPGACRMSLGPFLGREDIEFTLDAIRALDQRPAMVANEGAASS